MRAGNGIGAAVLLQIVVAKFKYIPVLDFQFYKSTILSSDGTNGVRRWNSCMFLCWGSTRGPTPGADVADNDAQNPNINCEEHQGCEP